MMEQPKRGAEIRLTAKGTVDHFTLETYGNISLPMAYTGKKPSINRSSFLAIAELDMQKTKLRAHFAETIGQQTI
jgi:hypothetical protein